MNFYIMNSLNGVCLVVCRYNDKGFLIFCDERIDVDEVLNLLVN